VLGIGVALALAASLMYGTSNVVSGAAVRRHATASLALWAQTTGLILVVALAITRRPQLTAIGLVWGVAAGAVGAVAVLLFYTALQRGRTSVVASVSGAGVAVPVLVGFAAGDAVGWRAAAGVLAAITGVLVVAAGSGDGPSRSVPRPVPTAVTIYPVDRHVATPSRAQAVPAADGCVPHPGSARSRSAVWLAAGSAIGFGSFFVLLKTATARAAAELSVLDNAVVVSLAVQIGALAVTLLAATRHTRRCIRLRRAVLLPATAVGLLDVGGDLVLTVAVGQGPISVIGPLGSLAPVVAVVVATVVLRERLRGGQTVGILLALGGIVLIATG
jgi:drug/metabolite transporter (DMT)-like permease